MIGSKGHSKHPQNDTALGALRSAMTVLPIVNETCSLEESVRVILQTCSSKDIEEYLIVVCDSPVESMLRNPQ